MDFSEESRPAIADMRNVPSKLPDVPDVSNVHSVPNFADVSDSPNMHSVPWRYELFRCELLSKVDIFDIRNNCFCLFAWRIYRNIV